jgi:hypothetical protein
MNDFFLDLWQDLREKRLWPVAVVLLLALVAVPFVLIKPAKVAPAPATPTASTSAKPLEPIGAGLLQPAEDPVSDGSALEAFLSKDPFKPIRALRKKAVVAHPTATSSPGAGSGSAGAAAGGASTAGSSVAGSTAGSGGGVPSGGRTTSTTKTWTYVADLRFGRTGHEKAYKSTKQLTVIPDARMPLIVFLGVTSDRKKAVFLVDSKLETSGEGRCKPSTKQCTFLYLAQDADNNEQIFTDEDRTEYTLRLSQLKKVELGSGDISGGGTGGKRPSQDGSGTGGPTAGGSMFGRSPRTFGFPLFGAEQTTVQTSGPATDR